MHNLIIGPICVFNAEDQIQVQCLDLIRENWMPVIILRRGEYFDLMMTRLHPDQKKAAKGLIISINYFKTYEA